MTGTLTLRNVLGHCLKRIKSIHLVPRCSFMTDMNIKLQPDHLDRTSDSYRGNKLYQAEISGLEDISPTTKLLTLRVFDSKFNFLAGQWVDFFIPFVDTIGGFSFCSSPLEVAERNEFKLAVKYSTHPPAHWVHSECQIGSRVTVRVGGNFHYPSRGVPDDADLLLVAGGVGINPLYSIYQYVGNRSLRAALLYSARVESELLFTAGIREVSASHQRLSHHFYLTRPDDSQPSTSDITVGRIDADRVGQALSKLDVGKLHCYICGPGPMIDSMEAVLVELGVDKERIHYEQWW